MQVVSFEVDQTRLGLDVQHVTGLVRMPEVTRLPGAPGHVEGVLNLRGQTVPVLSLHRLLRTAEPADPVQAYLVVVHDGSKTAAVVADRLGELCELQEGQLEEPTGSGPLVSLLSHVARLQPGVLFVLDPRRLVELFDESGLDATVQPDGSVAADQPRRPSSPLSAEAQATLRRRAVELARAVTAERVETRRFLTFRLGREKYAVPCRHVEKVLRVPDITPVPGAPEPFVGVVNYGGDVLWVASLKQLLRLPPTLAGNDERLVVVRYDDTAFGVLVDATDDVVDFPTAAIEAPLAKAEQAVDDWVLGQVYSDGQLVAILNLSGLQKV